MQLNRVENERGGVSSGLISSHRNQRRPHVQGAFLKFCPRDHYLTLK